MSTTIAIHGERFKSVGFDGPSAIHVGPTNGPTNVTDIVVVSDKLITCKVPTRDPSWPERVSIWITTPYGVGVRHNAFHYKPDPKFAVTSITPTTGHRGGGTSVVIRGYKFTTAVQVVWDVFGAEAVAGFVVDNDNQITAVSPSGTVGAPYGIKVRLASGEEYAFKCNNAEHPAWTYFGDPVIEIDELIPNHGSWLGGFTITVKGRGFVSIGLIHVDYLALTSADGTLVIVDDETATFTALSPSDMFFGPYETSGDNAVGQVPIYFSQPSGPYVAVIPFQLDKLTIESIAPTMISRVGGETVTMRGTALDTISAITFYDDTLGTSYAAASFAVVSPEEVTIVTPAFPSSAATQLRIQIVGLDPNLYGEIEGTADGFYHGQEWRWTVQIDRLP
jgi:hypothetical protein